MTTETLRAALQDMIEIFAHVADYRDEKNVVIAARAALAATAAPEQPATPQQRENAVQAQESAIGHAFAHGGPLRLTHPDGRVEVVVAPQPAERNFCPRCGKRTPDDSIHTCTPPAEQAELSDETIAELYQCTFNGMPGAARSAPKPLPLVFVFARAILAEAKRPVNSAP